MHKTEYICKIRQVFAMTNSLRLYETMLFVMAKVSLISRRPNKAMSFVMAKTCMVLQKYFLCYLPEVNLEIFSIIPDITMLFLMVKLV